jgi:hypothetical protein
VGEQKRNAMKHPRAETINNTVNVDIDQASDRFWVRDENGDDAQIRLEPDGTIYLCYTANNRRVIESCTLTWGEFLIRFRPLVDLIISQK